MHWKRRRRCNRSFKRGSVERESKLGAQGRPSAQHTAVPSSTPTQQPSGALVGNGGGGASALTSKLAARSSLVYF